MLNLFTVSALIACVLCQVLLRGGSIYRDMMKEEEARREEGHVFDVEVKYNNTIKQKYIFFAVHRWPELFHDG